MTYDERLQNVSILGAAGKMGSGILLLTAVEMADLSLKPENKDKTYVLNAIDISAKALSGLMEYLKVQIRKLAEKKINDLRFFYKDRSDLSENGEIIDQYIFDALNIVRPVLTIESAYHSYLVFEAASEDETLKIKLLSQIDANNPNKPWYFTNTSSIPIHVIDEKANLDGRILGFHFYNPPAVQKLVELIVTDKTQKDLIEFANNYAKSLRKVIVPANDIAGFIGNGHFMRDILFAVSEVERLSGKYTDVEAIYMINKISQDLLIRPMGIFQLVDYVGVDVCQFLMKVMQGYLTTQVIHSDLLDAMMNLNVKGGQNSDGSQKNGILQYEKGRVAGIYDMSKKDYVPVSELQAKCDAELGALPTKLQPWKAIISDKKKDVTLTDYFNELKVMDTLGADLAKKFSINSKNIGLKLISDGVAYSEDDVNKVLLTGFFHAYGPINNYL
jgi:3-hydroxyacyl-CoA dehydrogenase